MGNCGLFVGFLFVVVSISSSLFFGCLSLIFLFYLNYEPIAVHLFLFFSLLYTYKISRRISNQIKCTHFTRDHNITILDNRAVNKITEFDCFDFVGRLLYRPKYFFFSLTLSFFGSCPTPHVTHSNPALVLVWNFCRKTKIRQHYFFVKFMFSSPGHFDRNLSALAISLINER